jgi:hypothetical protein
MLLKLQIIKFIKNTFSNFSVLCWHREIGRRVDTLILLVFMRGGGCSHGMSMCRNGPSYGTEEMDREWQSRIFFQRGGDVNNRAVLRHVTRLRDVVWVSSHQDRVWGWDLLCPPELCHSYVAGDHSRSRSVFLARHPLCVLIIIVKNNSE